MRPARFPRSTRSATVAVLAATLALAGCEQPMDFDMRGRAGGTLDTSGAVRTASAPRPEPDVRGVISYPGYQVAVARRGDTVDSLAARVGLPASEIARFNGLQPNAVLRGDEIIALPRRVEAAPVAGTTGSGLDISAIAGSAIDRAAPTSSGAVGATETSVLPPVAPPGIEPIRHKVGRGETAFSIARLYSVSPRSLADWNGLGPDLAVREGQYLLIPVPVEQARAPEPDAAAPGRGSLTPVPPSAAQPLPRETAAAASAPPPSPNLGRQATAASSTSALAMPVQGTITQGFAKGRNEGIRIAAASGSAVSAAEAGEVAAITRDTDQVQILILRHSNGLLTVYANVTDITVKRGDRVRRGQRVASVGSGSPSYLHFEVREGSSAVDPVRYLQ